jgi:hypothetical protein
LKVNTLNERKQFDQHLYPSSPSPEFPYGWLEISNSPNTPTITWWIIGGRVHQNPNARKVTHLSIIQALGNLTSKFS